MDAPFLSPTALEVYLPAMARHDNETLQLRSFCIVLFAGIIPSGRNIATQPLILDLHPAIQPGSKKGLSVSAEPFCVLLGICLYFRE